MNTPATDSLLAWLDRNPGEDREEVLIKALRDAEEWLSYGLNDFNYERAMDSIRRYPKEATHAL